MKNKAKVTDPSLNEAFNKGRGNQPDLDHLIERLAAYAHGAWSGWMKYFFSKCEDQIIPGGKTGCVIVPAASVARWTRQMNTLYNELPLEERESDRLEARRIYAEVLGSMSEIPKLQSKVDRLEAQLKESQEHIARLERHDKEEDWT